MKNAGKLLQDLEAKKAAKDKRNEEMKKKLKERAMRLMQEAEDASSDESEENDENQESGCHFIKLYNKHTNLVYITNLNSNLCQLSNKDPSVNVSEEVSERVSENARKLIKLW